MCFLSTVWACLATFQLFAAATFQLFAQLCEGSFAWTNWWSILCRKSEIRHCPINYKAGPNRMFNLFIYHYFFLHLHNESIKICKKINRAKLFKSMINRNNICSVIKNVCLVNSSRILLLRLGMWALWSSLLGYQKSTTFYGMGYPKLGTLFSQQKCVFLSLVAKDGTIIPSFLWGL